MYFIGEKVDDMIIQSYEGTTKNYVKLFKVKCAICGAEKIIQYSRLNSHRCTFHNVKTCDYCHSVDKNIGLTINDYTIIKRVDKRYKTSAYYLAQCNICVNEQGTLEHLQKVSQIRLLLWHFRNFFKPFKLVQETKDFLRII